MLALCGCTTFRYSVISLTETETRREKQEIGVVRVEASDANKVACYLTVWMYGGWCWFIRPNSESDERAVEKANAIKNVNDKVDVRYLGRD